MAIVKFPTTFPAVFDEFQCKGGDCRNTCCQQWNINISRSEYNKVRHRCKNNPTVQKLFKRLPRDKATDTNYAKIDLGEDKFCPLFTSDGLCGLQLEYGYPTLPQVCKQFPRIITRISSDEHCLSLDTGCERTLELLWKYADSGIRFVHKEMQTHTFYGTEVSAETFLADYASDIRNLCIWLVQNRAYSLPDRLLLLGLAIRELQQIQDDHAPERLPAWFMKWQPHAKEDFLKEELAKIAGNREIFVINNLKLLWPLHLPLQNIYNCISEKLSFTMASEKATIVDGKLSFGSISFSLPQYNTLFDEFSSRFGSVDNFLENILVMNLFRQIFPFKYDSFWKNYTELCSLYSLLQFVAVATEPKTPQDLIDTWTVVSRMTINLRFFDQFSSDSLHSTNSDSLAHMAILLRG